MTVDVPTLKLCYLRGTMGVVKQVYFLVVIPLEELTKRISESDLFSDDAPIQTTLTIGVREDGDYIPCEYTPLEVDPEHPYIKEEDGYQKSLMGYFDLCESPLHLLEGKVNSALKGLEDQYIPVMLVEYKGEEK